MAAVGSAVVLLQVTLNTYTAEQQDNTVSGQPFFSHFAFEWPGLPENMNVDICRSKDASGWKIFRHLDCI